MNSVIKLVGKHCRAKKWAWNKITVSLWNPLPVVPETAIKLAMRNGSLQSIYWLPIQNLIKGIGLVIWNYPPSACDPWTTMIRHFIGCLREIVLPFTVPNTQYIFSLVFDLFRYCWKARIQSFGFLDKHKISFVLWIFSLEPSYNRFTHC